MSLDLWRAERAARYERASELAREADLAARRVCLFLEGLFPLAEVPAELERELGEKVSEWRTLEDSWSTAAEESIAFSEAGSPDEELEETVDALRALNPGVDVDEALARSLEALS